MFKDKRFIMKTKFLLSIIALGLFAACNDDSSSPVAANTDTPATQDPTAVVDPSQTTVTDPAADPAANVPVTDPTVTDPTVTDPVVTDPAVTDPTVTNPTATDPAVTDPTTPTDPAVTPETPVTYKYYGAELSGVDQFKYGRFEARMKMVSIPGSVSSMFLYYDNSWIKKEEPWNEIDIEVLGKSREMWQSNIITREGDPAYTGTSNSEAKHEFGYDATEDFHLFAIIWTPEYVAWEIDSVEIRRDTLGMNKGKHADADQVAFLTETETLRFNLWAANSAAWVGKFTGDELADGPQIQWIDYVRVYSYDETSKTFTQEWQDDFEGTSLSEHWNTGNWEMEKVMLTPDNVVVEDGFCKLLMTRVAE